MLLQVLCTVCNDMEVGRCESDDPSLISAIVLACHATQPHTSHKLRFLVDGNPPVEGDHEVRVICRHNNCMNAGVNYVYNVPRELVSGVILGFHSEHEGHAFELWYDGKKKHPPG